MATTIQTIAQAGAIRWAAQSEEAGPYFLMGDYLTINATFGARSVHVAEPGSYAQYGAFLTSRAAFRALEDARCGDLRGTVTIDGKEVNLRSHAIKLATEAARAEWKRWNESIYSIGGAYLDRFENAVIDRFERKWSAVRELPVILD
jgi:hypothetical protein